MALERLAHGLLMLLACGLAWFDFRHRRVPNRVTSLMAAAGLLLHFPGSAPVWAACVVLFWGRRLGFLGGGDAKLWMGLLWLVPASLSSDAVLVMAFVFMSTGLLQMAIRRVMGLPVLGVRSPGAWRVLPFAAWLLVV